VRLIKMTGLAAVVAAVAMALIGAGSASATVLCKENKSPCGSAYPVPTSISASLKAGTTAKLVSSLGTVECSVSTSSGETTTAGTPLLGTIKTLTFSSCVLGKTACTVTSEDLPFKASISASGGGNGSMTVSDSGKGEPRAFVKCGSAIECIFGQTSATLTAIGSSTAPLLKAEAIELKIKKNEGFICPSSAKWTAEYVVSPAPLFVI
jgi:hypothetical protein